MRETVFEYWLATHAEPGAMVTAVGPLPTGIVATTAPLAGSIFETVESSALVTQTASWPRAIALGPLPVRVVETVCPEQRSTSATEPAP
jgi:hypothetical protein